MECKRGICLKTRNYFYQKTDETDDVDLSRRRTGTTFLKKFDNNFKYKLFALIGR